MIKKSWNYRKKDRFITSLIVSHVCKATIKARFSRNSILSFFYKKMFKHQKKSWESASVPLRIEIFNASRNETHKKTIIKDKKRPHTKKFHLKLTLSLFSKVFPLSNIQPLFAYSIVHIQFFLTGVRDSHRR